LLRISEILSIAYGVYVALMAALPRWGWRRRILVWICAALMTGTPAALSALAQSPSVVLARDWAPAIYILISYYASGALFVGPSAPFEAWLARADSRLPHLANLRRIPPTPEAIFEVLYGATFLVIPAGFAVLVASGLRAQADRYWTMVSLSEYVAFGFLPWLPSRPPWLVERLNPEESRGMRKAGLRWARRTSHCANTFPSGHTAGSLTVALAVIPFAPLAGVALLAVAIGIAIGCIAGRYHYAVDVLAGVALALCVLALTAWAS
jgi:membrane-associated phospholipid phosphatase